LQNIIVLPLVFMENVKKGMHVNVIPHLLLDGPELIVKLPSAIVSLDAVQDNVLLPIIVIAVVLVGRSMQQVSRAASPSVQFHAFMVYV